MMYIYNMKQLSENIDNGRIVGCDHCKSLFEEDDKAFVKETGNCPYCHKLLDRATTV
jgi:glutaredoxin